jgi:HEAT repeat protein
MIRPVPKPPQIPGQPISDERTELSDQHLIRQVKYAADPEDRASGLKSLGFRKATPEIVQVCVDALVDPNEEVRVEAALALDTLQEVSAIPSLIDALKNEASNKVRPKFPGGLS